MAEIANMGYVVDGVEWADWADGLWFWELYAVTVGRTDGTDHTS